MKFFPNVSRVWVFLLLIVGTVNGRAQTELFIGRGMWTQVPDSVSCLRFSADSSWNEINSNLERAANEISTVTVHNTDSIAHSWTLHVPGFISVLIDAGTSETIDLPSLPVGTYAFGLTDPIGSLLGAKGMLQIGLNQSGSLPLFHWNLGDWNTLSMAAAAAGELPDETAPYVPNQFTINDRTYPNTIEDTDGSVELQLNDTCWIAVANHGQMDHVLHFHGFHVTILTSTQHPERVNWSKDTVPIKKGEGLTLQLVANQTGIYPVHDHNLIAVTNAGFYPGGMITQISVVP